MTTEERLKEIATLLDAECESAEEYAKSEDGSEAEYCESFGYGDGEPELDRLEDDAKAFVEELASLVNRDSFRNILRECSDLSLEGIYTCSNEIFSISIGELEHQYDDDLAAEVKTLTAEERDKVDRMMRNGCLGSTCADCVYVSCDYDRWVLVLDPEKLEEKLKAIRKSKPSRKRSRRPSTKSAESKQRPKLSCIHGDGINAIRRDWTPKVIVGGAA